MTGDEEDRSGEEAPKTTTTATTSNANDKTEPATLATPGTSSSLQAPPTPDSPHSMNMSDHVKETRELKGLAKQWDEQDRVAKRQYGRGTRRPSDTKDGGSEEVPPASISPAHRMTLSQEKRRATYLSTGLKPGAYPDRTPYENIMAEAETRPFSDAQRLEAEVNDTSKNSGLQMPDLEQGSASQASLRSAEPPQQQEETLVEAFVVNDEQPSVAVLPMPKQGISAPALIEGDYVEKAEPVLEDEKVGIVDILLHRNMLMLIGGLVCCFVIAAVIVVVVVMTVVNGGGGDGSSSNALVGPDTPSPETTNAPTTMAPTAIPDLVPTAAPNASVPEGTQPEPTLEPTSSPDDITNTTAPTEPEVSEPPSAAPSVAPTAPEEPPTTGPLTAEPLTTEPPTTEPTVAPTPDPTPRPTVAPTTPRPTPQPTSPPTTPPPTAAEPPDFDPLLTARVEYIVTYTIASSSEPSLQEQAALDQALVEYFTSSITDDIDTLDDYYMVSSSQSDEPAGWVQTVVVDYLFEAPLPPLQTILNALGSSDARTYLVAHVKPIGTVMATTSSIAFEFDVPTYPGRRR